MNRSARSLMMMGNKNGFKKGYIPHNKGKPTCKVNEDYFKTWSPNMAYILGIIATDGCLSETRGMYKLTFVSIEVDLLIKISEEMGSTYKIGIHNTSGHVWYQHQIYSKKIYDDLLDIGLTPRKTYTLKFPTIPEEYESHFIRGVFDGDGNVSKVITKYKGQPTSCTVWTSIVSASLLFINTLKLKLKIKGLSGGHIYVKQPKEHNKQKVPCYEACFRKFDSLKLYELIYLNATLFSTLKKQKFDTIMGLVPW